MWLSKARLLAPLWFCWGSGFASRTICYADLLDQTKELEPYEALAPLWHELSYRTTANYPHYLAGLLRRRNILPKAVLDLACGPGSNVEKLAVLFAEAVGLDCSPAMLEQGRKRCADVPNATFVHADFRNFNLGRRFDAVLCANDSLNYVADVSELAQVFRSVADHLHPGGVFVFDTITERGVSWLSGVNYHAEVSGTRLVVAFHYDPEERRETSRAYFPGGTETHRRIPIDPVDVQNALHGTSLVLEDYFSFASLPGRWLIGTRCFFVVSRQR